MLLYYYIILLHTESKEQEAQEVVFVFVFGTSTAVTASIYSRGYISGIMLGLYVELLLGLYSGLYTDYIGIMEKNMETTIACLGRDVDEIMTLVSWERRATL